MRRMLSAVIASALVALALPAAAAAHHRHHHSRHAGKHHATSARIVTFGAASTSAGPSSTSPTTPTTGESAGTVLTFDEETGVLTIELADKKTTVSGKVTDDTELHCRSATPPEGSGDDQDEGDNGGGEQSGDGADSGGFADGHGDFMAHSADSQDDEGTSQETCTRAALTKGTVVLEAELELMGTGAVWEKLDIVH
jgi:hypothetical protein